MFSKVACFHCKKSKRKCDKEIPVCSPCLKQGRECHYPELDGRKPATNTYVNSLLARIRSLEKSLSLYKSSDISEASETYSRAYINSENRIRSSKRPTLQSGFNLTQPLPNVENRNLFQLRWQLSMSEYGQISCEGPTSLRYISVSADNPARSFKKADISELFDEFHQEVFGWFFKCIDNSFPLIEKNLFISSVQEVLEGDQLGDYSSLSLINSIMSFYFLYKGDLDEFTNFKALAVKQLENELKTNPNITNVQALILLSHVSMIEGDEFQASQLIARATAVSYHLGLHVSCVSLVDEGKMTQEESILRSNVFWCCHLSDRLRCVILGMHPYMNCSDISIDLPSGLHTLGRNEGYQEFEVFKESVIFHDLEIEKCEECFSSELAFNLQSKPAEFAHNEQRLVVSNALIAVCDWQKEMSSQARFFNNKSINAMQLEVNILTVKILFNKTLLREPLLREEETESVSGICLISARKIIKLCSDYELTESLFLFRFIYSIYLSSVIFLFNMTSSNLEIGSSSRISFMKAFKLFKKYQRCAPVIATYLEHLSKFAKSWVSHEFEIMSLFGHDSIIDDDAD